MAKNVASIPAGTPFAKTLAAKLLADTHGAPEALARYQIFLPTRRACRTLQETFLSLSDGKPLLLPKLLTLGQVDEEELSLSIAGHDGDNPLLDLPPAIRPIQRQMLLAQLVQQMGEKHVKTPPQAFALAQALGRLMDQIYTENLQLSDLHKIVPEEFADHWQITLDFLKILEEHWPKILAEQGLIDIADRRTRLTLALAEHWRAHPPQTPIIAAGSTGSIPTTAILLDTIAGLPQGQVILPGLDQYMDEDSWNALEENHPQYGLHQLLHHMQITRTDVPDLTPATSTRIALASEIMRPAATSHHWMDTQINPDALENLSLITTSSDHEEATTIALLIREILEHPKKTVTLITPDRNLARRVTSICKRWDVDVDDSAGTPLHKSGTGTFLRLILETIISNYAPVPFLALLKHPYFCIAMNRKDLLKGINDLERYALRGPRPAPGIESLIARLESAESERGIHLAEARQILEVTAPISKRVNNGSSEKNTFNFNQLIRNHIDIAEKCAATMTQNGTETLWRGESGEMAANLLSELTQHNVSFPEITLPFYSDILQIILESQTVRPAFGMHPRVKILGQIEARLIDSDLLILSGLNEGTWPPSPAADPWMSRPMRKDFGLPSHERAIGLAAHDFAQALCAPHVILTRAERSNGTPQIPARWLQRLDTVLKAVDLQDKLDTMPHIKAWTKTLDQAESSTQITRPAPCPPVEKRPTKLSVTQIETWLKDPYSIYARHILKLKPLDPIDMQNDAATKGTLIHDILDKFITAHPDHLPENSPEIIENITRNALEEHIFDPSLRSFLTPRINRLTTWFINNETVWRENINHCNCEIKGQIMLPTRHGAFTLTARADRIDQVKNTAICTENAPETGAIIDYKSGGNYSVKDMTESRLPQLPLEALILSKGGFENLPTMDVSYLGYWTLTGGNPPATITKTEDHIADIAARAEEGLTTLIETFADETTPYYAIPDLENVPRFNDYEHLARVREWAVLSEGSESATSQEGTAA